MRRLVPAAFLLAAVLAPAAVAQPVPAVGTPGTLDVATWNLKFFGRTDQGPTNEPLQFHNIATVLRRAEIDVWGLQEVTDPPTFQRLLDSLSADGYAGHLGPQVSQSPAFDQRLAFVYRSSALTVQGVGTILSGNNFGGRAPLEMRATVVLGDTSVAVRFIVFHAKAGGSTSDYNQRAAGASALKQYIDPLIAGGEHVVLLGDFNDELNGSITIGQTFSPYFGMFADAADYLFTTAPLDAANVPTYCSNTACTSGSTLDHIALTAHLLDDYDGEGDRFAALLDVFDAHGGEFVTTTSDHLPVWARLDLAGPTVPAEPGAPARTLALAPPAPNPAAGAVALAYSLERPADVRLEVLDVLGRRMAMVDEGARVAGPHRASLDASALAPGLYLVRLTADGATATQRLVRR